MEQWWRSLALRRCILQVTKASGGEDRAKEVSTAGFFERFQILIKMNECS